MIGDTTPDHIMIETIIKNDFHFEKALDQILAQQSKCMIVCMPFFSVPLTTSFPYIG